MEPQKIIFVIGFKLSKYALSFVFFYLMVLFYSPKTIGTVQFAIAFVTIFSFIFNLGFTIAHLKIYPEEKDKAACIGTLLTFKGFFIIISLFFYFLLLNFLNLDLVLTIIFTIFIFEQIIQGLNSTMSNILIADGEVVRGSFPWIVISGSKIVLLIFGLYIFPTNEITLAIIYLLSTSFHTLLLFIFVVHYKIKKPRKYLLSKYLKYTYPLSFSAIIVLISGNIGLILINVWISTEAVAFYYAGDHLAVFRTILPNVISLVMVPIFSKNYMEKKIEKNKLIIKNITKYFSILWAGIIALSFLYSDELIIIFLGDTYRPSILVFNILILSQIIIINDIAVLTDLNARGLTKQFSTIKIIGECYNILLTILFIAPFGLNLGISGVALSILFKNLTYSPIIRFYLWKKYNYSFNFEILLYLLAALIVILINPVYTSHFNLIKVYYLVPVFVFIDITLFIGILFILRVLKKNDLKNIKSILNVKNLMKILYEDLTSKNEKNQEF